MMLPAIFSFAKLLPVVFANTCSANNFFFFLPPWYKYLASSGKMNANCNLITDPNVTPHFVFPADIWLIGLAILDMLLRLAGFVAVISIIIAGVSYITATGEPDKAAAARRRLYNSLIGLAIALIATALVSFVGNSLGT